MRKIYSYLSILAIVVYLSFSPFIHYTEAKNPSEQPEVCQGPSKTMSLYFQFQKDVMSAILGSEINEKRFVTTKSDGGLFKENFLTLNKGNINALNLIATSVRGNMQATESRITTLAVLLSLASLSVGQSNTEGLRILVKDRVIVREYKQMLNIETSLMELAYFLSQHVNLEREYDGTLVTNFKSVVKKYQAAGLLKETDLNDLGNITIADILEDMIMMNAYMKHFVLYNGGLDNYKGCMGNYAESKYGYTECKSSTVLQFHEKAITQLEEDYRGLGVFGACNQYASNFKNTLSKGANNNKNEIANAISDVKASLKRLGSALNFSHKDGSSDGKSSRCNLSYYEMAQLKSYRGGNWTCEDGLINGTFSLDSAYVRDFTTAKKSQQSQKEKTTNMGELSKQAKKEAKEKEKEQKQKEKEQKKEEKQKAKEQKKEEKEKNKKRLEDLRKMIDDAKTTQEKQNIWYEVYGDGQIFSIQYSGGFSDSLAEIHAGLMNEYEQSHENAISSDISPELLRIKEVLDQIDNTSDEAVNLKKKLEDVAVYQCGRK